MPAPKISLPRKYYPAVLRKNKNSWLIDYYAMNPTTGELQRRQIKLNRVRERYAKLADFKLYANEMMCHINAKLAGGWSPFFESGENTRLYTPLSEVAKLYLEEKTKELRPATLASYRSFCKMFINWATDNVPKCYASTFNRVLAVQYLDYIYADRNVGARTFNNHLKMGRAFFGWALQKCYIKENPFEVIKNKREDTKKRIIIPADVRKRIANYCQEKKPTYLLVCELVYTSLIRPKEINLIQLKDIDLEGKNIRIPSTNAKTHNERYAAINDQIYNELLKLDLGSYPKDFFLFGSDLRPAKTRCGVALFRKIWDKVRNDLHLPKEMQLYSFRDTGINEMLTAGIDALTVMQHADHHDLAITTRYANHVNKDLATKIWNLAPDF